MLWSTTTSVTPSRRSSSSRSDIRDVSPPGQPGERLVDEQHVGVGRQRAAEFEAEQPRVGEFVGRAVELVAEADTVTERRRLRARLPAQPGRREQLVGDQHRPDVRQDGPVVERAELLEGARQAAVDHLVSGRAGGRLAAVVDGPRGREVPAGDAVERRRFTCPVRADEAEYFPPP
jgi:hypothetical protein